MVSRYCYIKCYFNVLVLCNFFSKSCHRKKPQRYCNNSILIIRFIQNHKEISHDIMLYVFIDTFCLCKQAGPIYSMDQVLYNI